MTAARDPRSEPVKGDVLSRLRLMRKVDCVRANHVDYTYPDGTNYRTCTLASWRKWARDAQVIKQ